MTTMSKRHMGSTTLSVGAIGMGCMPISVNGRPSEAQGIATIHAALEQGITLFDTADAYCLDDTEVGHNERVIAKAISGHPDAIVATKGGHIRPEGRWEPNGHPAYLKAACEASLRALGLETIILYQFHRPDPAVPFLESVGALADLQREGKIVHAGLSNVSVAQLDAALDVLPIASVQNRMNIFDRSSMPVLKRCEELGIAFLPYSPLDGMGNAGGIGKHPTLARIATAHGVSAQQVALAWLLQLSPVVLPIPGASKAHNIVDCAKACEWTLTAAEIAELTAIA